VVKQYDKATDCQNEFKEAVKAFQKREQELKEELDDLRKKLDTERLTPEKREAAEKKGRQLSRQMFELQEEARSTIAKKQERQVTEIYTDIRQAAQRYAAAHNVALVMHYNDALPDSPDFSSSQNVTRKIQAGALMPVYIAPGIDITRELIEDLNERYRHENAVEGDD
jgi:Skp family chaperone for outer membrane proteins